MLSFSSKIHTFFFCLFFLIFLEVSFPYIFICIKQTLLFFLPHNLCPNRLCTGGSGGDLFVEDVCELVSTKRQKDFYNNSTKSQCKPST